MFLSQLEAEREQNALLRKQHELDSLSLREETSDLRAQVDKLRERCQQVRNQWSQGSKSAGRCGWDLSVVRLGRVFVVSLSWGRDVVYVHVHVAAAAAAAL